MKIVRVVRRDDGLLQQPGLHQSRLRNLPEAAAEMGRVHLQARLEGAADLRHGEKLASAPNKIGPLSTFRYIGAC